MPQGKPAGVRCLHLSVDNRCTLFGRPERPDVCRRFQPCEEVCGRSTLEALINLTRLERATTPWRNLLWEQRRSYLTSCARSPDRSFCVVRQWRGPACWAPAALSTQVLYQGCMGSVPNRPLPLRAPGA